MASRMRYGPRFGSGGVSSKYSYDERIDRGLQETHARFVALRKGRPQYKNELSDHKHKKSCALTNGKKRKGTQREDAEARMAEVVRKAVEMLEFHMTDMMQYPQVKGRPVFVNQFALHNTLVYLKTRCGVKFEDNEYVHTYQLDRVHLNDAQDACERATEEFFNKELDARDAREKRMRAVAERLMARPKG